MTRVMPSTPVRDPQPFLAAINTIHSGGSTALFAGWLAGATQVANHLEPAALNRVLLLSDGQANEGLTDPNKTAAKVAGLTARGSSTSAFGLGTGFDEDTSLMRHPHCRQMADVAFTLDLSVFCGAVKG